MSAVLQHQKQKIFQVFWSSHSWSILEIIHRTEIKKDCLQIKEYKIQKRKNTKVVQQNKLNIHCYSKAFNHRISQFLIEFKLFSEWKLLHWTFKQGYTIFIYYTISFQFYVNGLKHNYCLKSFWNSSSNSFQVGLFFQIFYVLTWYIQSDIYNLQQFLGM